MLNSIANFVLSAYALALLASVVLFNYYSLLKNATNHTGAPLSTVSMVYLATLLVSLVIMFIGWKDLNRGKTTFFLLAAVAVISLIGFINIAAYDYLNIMMYYKDWIHKGMPPKPHLF